MAAPETTAVQKVTRPAVVSLAVRNKASLYAAYIPWLRNGGIFLSTERTSQLGEPMLVILSLMDEPAKIPIVGQVAWVTPPNAHGNRPQGLGVQFAENGPLKELKKRIEGILAGALQSTKPTHTL
jgi:type IV pilus assembly protein PilZ